MSDYEAFLAAPADDRRGAFLTTANRLSTAEVNVEKDFWVDKRGVLRGGGQRVTRHYYDLHRLMGSEVGPAAAANLALGADCVAHARMFFNSPDLDLASAEPGRFALAPNDDMLEPLARDYRAMSGMIFGETPPFEAVMASVGALERRLNASAPQSS